MQPHKHASTLLFGELGVYFKVLFTINVGV